MRLKKPKSYESVKKITRLKCESSPFLLAINRYRLILCKLFYIDRSSPLIILVNKDKHFYNKQWYPLLASLLQFNVKKISASISGKVREIEAQTKSCFFIKKTCILSFNVFFGLPVELRRSTILLLLQFFRQKHIFFSYYNCLLQSLSYCEIS